MATESDIHPLEKEIRGTKKVSTMGYNSHPLKTNKQKWHVLKIHDKSTCRSELMQQVVELALTILWETDESRINKHENNIHYVSKGRVYEDKMKNQTHKDLEFRSPSVIKLPFSHNHQKYQIEGVMTTGDIHN